MNTTVRRYRLIEINPRFPAWVYLASAAQVRGRLNRMCVQAVREHVRLRTSALGADAELLGAAELAFERLLADPLDIANGPASDPEL